MTCIINLKMIQSTFDYGNINDILIFMEDKTKYL